MRGRSFAGGCALLVAAIAGCYTGGDITPPDRRAPSATSSVTGTDPASVTSVTGVPCDVAQVLAKDCATCHATVPTGGAPNAMMSYDELVAPSRTMPSTSVIELSIARMKDASSPMPPDGASADDLAVLEKWYAAGTPPSSEACDATPGASIYDTPSACSSKKTWTNGERGSPLMLPGEACNQCHDKGRGPSYTAAGTVYATAHEPDACYGTSSKTVQVVITDAAKKTYTATVNAAGNFFFNDAIKMPYKAKVVSGAKSRSMSGAQTDGDCNKCHTENGTKLKGDTQEAAPGRVMAP